MNNIADRIINMIIMLIFGIIIGILLTTLYYQKKIKDINAEYHNIENMFYKDSIRNNITILDSIVNNHKLKLIENEQKINSLNDSDSVKLFYELINS